MRLSTPKPGTIVACLALLIAMGGTADAVTHTKSGASTGPVVLNIPAGHASVHASCSLVKFGPKKAFSVAHAGFFNVDSTGAISTTAAWTIKTSGSFAGPSLSWEVDGKSVGGASTRPVLGPHVRFSPGSDTESTPLWLKSGTHTLALSITPFAVVNNKPRCASYTTTYSNLHARLSAVK